MQNESWVGGCACGAVRYASTGAPLFPFRPRALRRCAPNAPMARGARGQLGPHACGSPLYGEPQGHTDVITIRAGSLDDPRAFRPTGDIYTARAQPWDYMNPELPKTELLG